MNIHEHGRFYGYPPGPWEKFASDVPNISFWFIFSKKNNTEEFISLSQRKPLPVPWGISCRSTERPQVPRIRAFWLALATEWPKNSPRNMPIPVLRCCKAADPIIRPVPTVVLFWGTYRNLEYPHQRGWFIGWFIIRLVTLGADVPLLTRAIPARSTYRHLNYVVHVNVDELPSPFSNSYGHPNYPNSSPSLRNLPFNSAQFLPGTKVLMCTTEPLHCFKSSTVLLSSAVSSLRSSSARTSPRCGASSMALTPATVPKAAPRWRTRIPKLRPRGRQTRRPSGQAK